MYIEDAISTNHRFVDFVEERENDLFEKEKFRALGKQDDYIFQTLVFMGRASQQMSIGFTIADTLNEIPQSIKEEMRDLARRYHGLQEQIRNLSKEGG
ncbi:hypothetical protein [Cytobacillus firmus]|uniref:Uncharacterized protein n=1 Tax=Cytobacillus firmus DS1 TaxID=1307436 RepID=W7L042_CYTFI|nr:hypothetical protein [Cytobacillus firmus]EWG08422.1 hypothetical protein PBF_24313 [Cytobacillus firmus DS1]